MTDKKPTQWGGIAIGLLLAYNGSVNADSFGGLALPFYLGGGILAYFLYKWVTKKATFIKNDNLRGFLCGLPIFILFWFLCPVLAAFLWLSIQGAA